MSAAIGGAASAANQQTNSIGNAYSNLSSGEFLKIILSELTNQDPLAPNDTAAILEQLSSLRNIESQNALETKLDALVTQNAISASAGMIGNFVRGLDSFNNEVEGLVESLSVVDGKPVLNLASGKTLDADRVTEVMDLSDLNGSVVQQLLRELQLLDTSSLVGMRVAGTTKAADGTTLTPEGVVTRVSFEDGEIMLELEGQDVMLPLADVESFGRAD